MVHTILLARFDHMELYICMLGMETSWMVYFSTSVLTRAGVGSVRGGVGSGWHQILPYTWSPVSGEQHERTHSISYIIEYSSIESFSKSSCIYNTVLYKEKVYIYTVKPVT